MEAKKDIGKAFREKLDRLERQPGDAMWAAISADLDRKKKKRFPFFWLFIFGCVGILATVAVVFGEYGSEGKSPKPDTTKTGNTISVPSGHTNAAATTTSIDTGKKDTIIFTPNEHSAPVKNRNSPTAAEAQNAVQTTPAKLPSVKAKHGPSKNSNTFNNRPYGNAGGRNTTVDTGERGRKATREKKGQIVNSNKPKSTKAVGEASSQPGEKNAVSIYQRESDIGVRLDKNQNNTSNLPSPPPAKAVATGLDDNSREKAETGTVVGDGSTAATVVSITDTIHIVKDSITAEVPKDSADETKDETKKDSLLPPSAKKISVFAFAGPAIHRFPDSSIKTDDSASAITTASSFTYGALLGYSLTEKFSVRAGISFSRIKQTSDDIILTNISGSVAGPAIPASNFNWVDYNRETGNEQVVNTLGDGSTAVINITRELSYMDIPVEVCYSPLSGRFGVTIFAGGSVIIVNKNEVFAGNAGGTMLLGKWNAVSNTSFSARLGLGAYYRITPSLQLNAEPIMRYYINTFNEYKPYTLTVRVGLQYNFDF